MFDDFEFDWGVLLPALAMWIIVSALFLIVGKNFNTSAWVQTGFIVGLAPLTYWVFNRAANK